MKGGFGGCDADIGSAIIGPNRDIMKNVLCNVERISGFIPGLTSWFDDFVYTRAYLSDILPPAPSNWSSLGIGPKPSTRNDHQRVELVVWKRQLGFVAPTGFN